MDNYDHQTFSIEDGNKRIAAIIFLFFLEKNDSIYINGKRRMDEQTPPTLTILIASSNVHDREQIINLIHVLIQGE